MGKNNTGVSSLDDVSFNFTTDAKRVNDTDMTLTTISTVIANTSESIEVDNASGDPTALRRFIIFIAVFLIASAFLMLLVYRQRKKRERLRMAFKPIYNLDEGDEGDWDVNVSDIHTTVQIKDRKHLTSPSNQPFNHQVKTDNNNHSGVLTSKMFSSPLSSNNNSSFSSSFNKESKVRNEPGPASLPPNGGGAVLQFNLNGNDVEDVVHPELLSQLPSTKNSPT